MIIRKKYRVEMGHIVRNCSSDRCAHSMHGHSAVIEVLLSGNKLDDAGMLYDFGLMKGTVKEFIDLFDHCYVFWDKDDNEFIKGCLKWNARWVSLPFNPTAEMLSLMFMNAINRIIQNTPKKNNEALDLRCVGVIYHETESGYAQCGEEDKQLWNPNNLDDMHFSNDLETGMSYELTTSFIKNQLLPKQFEPFRQVNADATGYRR